jgi:hypothetical protein
MKKFLAFLILLLIIAGTVFYFGWVQIRLPEHTYGVIFTKTSGYHPNVVRPGTFVWKWERLIPTNFTMHRFTVEPHTVRVSQEGTLPSAEVYADTLEESPAFDYRFDFTLSYELRPEALPSLVEEEALKPDSMDAWYETRSQEMLAEITSFLSDEIEALDSADPTRLQFGALQERLLETLRAENPGLEVKNLVISQLELPDFELYFSAREFYFELLDTRRAAEKETMERSRSWRVSEEAKLEVLGEYGKLFTEYPGLIRYLALKERESIENMLPEIEILEEVFGESAASGDTAPAGENEQ